MKSRKEFAITTIITVALVLIIAFCISETVIGQDKGDAKAKEQYYQTAEREYVQEIRRLLKEEGFSNSGVTMNRVIEADGTREYTVTIHHRRIEGLSDEQKKGLLSECQELGFPVENCSIFHEFFVSKEE